MEKGHENPEIVLILRGKAAQKKGRFSGYFFVIVGRNNWWSVSTFSGNSTNFVNFNNNGNANNNNANNDNRGPV